MFYFVLLNLATINHMGYMKNKLYMTKYFQRSTRKNVICMLQKYVFSSNTLNTLQLYYLQIYYTSQDTL